MADLKFIGRILGVIGGLIMVIVGIIAVINGVLGEALVNLNISGFDLGFNFVSGAVGGDLAWLIGAAVVIICGLVAIYGYKELAGKADVLVWGIIYIVVGLIGGSLGGLLVLIGGIVLLIDKFI